MITEDELKLFNPKMQEAIRFVQWWNLSRDLAEFLAVMGKEVSSKSKLWAGNTATKFRKHGVNLRKLTDKTGYDVDLDYSYLQVIGEKSIAELGRRKDEAESLTRDIDSMRAEAFRILQELRKFKTITVDRERLAEILATSTPRGTNGTRT